MKSKRENNPQAHKKIYWQEVAKETGRCSTCPPHGGENARISRKGKYGKTKPKYKNRRA